MHLQWAFGPGVINKVADFLSRNPKDREALRGPELEDGELGPGVTFKHIMEQVTLRQPDRDKTLAKIGLKVPRWDPKELEDHPDPSPKVEVQVQQGQHARVVASPVRTPTGRRVVCGLWLPSASVERRPMDLPRVVSTEIVVIPRMRLEPEFLCTSSPIDDKEDGTCLCCRWTTETDRTIPQDRKVRAHYADSALQILRALKQSGAEAILAQGEAFVPCLMLCSETLRNYAYDRARVSAAQRVEHNATFYRLRYLLLHCPCAHPSSVVGVVPQRLAAEHQTWHKRLPLGQNGLRPTLL